MNFGPQLNAEQSRDMTLRFLQSGNSEIDTAYVYNNGDTERILGSFLSSLPNSSYKIETKVHPRITGKLDRDTIIMELTESLYRMKLKCIDTLYFHFPDRETPIEDAIATFAELHEKGIVTKLGLSNYPSWQVIDLAYKCDKIGCPRPSVYQGMYNALCRNVEPELFDAIHSLNMCFYAFNPLAGGMLTGKHRQFESTPQPGRFARLQSYRDRYWKQSYFDAIEVIKLACDQENIPMAEAAYRWLVNHSKLISGNGDGILIGASSDQQLTQNIHSSEQGNLPTSVLEAIDKAWDIVKPNSPSYFKYIN